jgi:hypothetical protein
VIRVLKDEQFVNSQMTEMPTLVDWLRRDNYGEVHGIENRKAERKWRIEALQAVFLALELPPGQVESFVRGKWALERIIRKSRSRYLKAIGEIRGPSRQTVKSVGPFGLEHRLPGSFETGRR